MADVLVVDHGLIVIITPITEEALQWCADHLLKDAPMRGVGYAVEPSYVSDICTGMEDDGLVVE